MKKVLLFALIGLCIAMECSAQSKSRLGITAGLQPALRNQVEEVGRADVSDFPIFFMKHFTLGVFFRHDLTKHFYTETTINASLDAQWGYVSDGVTMWDEFARAFDRPNKVHIDIPIYLGFYIIKKDALNIRVFGCPQYKIRASTDLNFSSIDWNNFSINIGAGIDFLSFFTFNVNYRIPINYGVTSFPETRIAATLGFVL